MSSQTILCFGDSNTWGYIPGKDCERYAPDTRWPGVLQAGLGDEYRVVEEGQNGRMTAWDDPLALNISRNGLKQLPVILESQKPIDLVIVMLGTNDLKSYMNHSASDIALGAIAVVDLILASNAGPDKQAPGVLLICPAAVSERDSFGPVLEGAAEKSQAMSAAYAALAEERGVAFLDAGIYVTCPEPDGIHLDEDGHAALGMAVTVKVKAMGV